MAMPVLTGPSVGPTRTIHALGQQPLEALEVHAPDLALLVRHRLREVVARRV
jgi:hypothetical protein